MRLAFHQDLQERLFEEAQKIAPDFQDITMENSPYIFAFLHEVLRLHCPVNVVPMKCRKETQISSSGKSYDIPPGFVFDISIHAIHLNAKHWKEPLTFDPNRFLDGEGKFASPSAFMPFAIGPRACIGKQIALMELTIASAMLVHKFKVTPLESFQRCNLWLARITREMKYRTPYKLELR